MYERAEYQSITDNLSGRYLYRSQARWINIIIRTLSVAVGFEIRNNQSLRKITYFDNFTKIIGFVKTKSIKLEEKIEKLHVFAVSLLSKLRKMSFLGTGFRNL